jgi:hypothetical protein
VFQSTIHGQHQHVHWPASTPTGGGQSLQPDPTKATGNKFDQSSLLPTALHKAQPQFITAAARALKSRPQWARRSTAHFRFRSTRFYGTSLPLSHYTSIVYIPCMKFPHPVLCRHHSHAHVVQALLLLPVRRNTTCSKCRLLYMLMLTVYSTTYKRH